MLQKISRTALALTLSCAAALTVIPAKPASAQSAIIGQLMAFAGNFCPRGWANADGSLIAISNNSALFSIYGTMYGGDGRTTFALPDLRNRTIVHLGNGPGIGNSGPQGLRTGATSVTLSQSNLPRHTHQVMAAQTQADSSSPSDNLLAGSASYHGASGISQVVMSSKMVSTTGANQALQKRSPVQVIRYCIALYGVYPSRP